MIDSRTIAWIGGSLVVVFSFAFVRVLQLKIQGWNRSQISPLPLEGLFSVISYVGSLSGLTIMFVGVLETFAFSPTKSLIASLVLAFTTGFPMWGVVKGLLIEVEENNVKEIIPGKF